MDIFNQIIDVCAGKEGKILTASDIKTLVSSKFGTNLSSILPSDYCYNRYNEGIKFDKHLFVMINRSEYKFIGEDYPYSGRVYWKPKGQKNERIVGIWKNGKYQLFERQENPDKRTGYLNQEQIQNLYEEYIGILELEVNVFGVKPTEARHLIGRIGEFKCALMTGGTLAHEVNQHGFDVVSNHRKISVKTTAQKAGFISLNKNTLAKVDELMILQYNKNEFEIVYYGDIERAIEQARPFREKFELDLSKAKKLVSKNIEWS